MGWVDRAKSARARLVEAALPAPVVFHHVPKCGGTSVGRALRKRYLLSQATVAPESSFRAFAAFSGRTDREQMLIDVLDLREQMLLYLLYENVRCVSAHVRFSRAAHAMFGDRYAFATVLREPVSRFISHYFWSHAKRDAHGRIDEEFAAFLGTPRAARLGAVYVQYFSGLPKEADLTSPAAIAEATANLEKFDVVGTLDNLGSFRRALKKRLGVNLHFGRENRMRQSVGHKNEIVTANLRRRVERLCGPDLTVWKSVVEQRVPQIHAETLESDLVRAQP